MEYSPDNLIQMTTAVSHTSSAASRSVYPRTANAAQRLLFIDNLRSTMIVLVVSMHAADTYSPVGRWYYTERPALSMGAAFFLVTWQVFLQSFFMGLLFFFAGYFTPSAFDKKGSARFIKDRAFRLGLPVLFYMFVLGPLTEYYVAHSWRSARPSTFAEQWLLHIRNGEFLSGSGPLWFCAALLIFCIVYLLARNVLPGAHSSSVERLPGNRGLLAFALAMGLLTFAVRTVAPGGTVILNLQLADFPQYILLFVAGILAYRGEWLLRFPYQRGVRWLVTC